jgi:glycine C-acetyltransferase
MYTSLQKSSKSLPLRRLIGKRIIKTIHTMADIFEKLMKNAGPLGQHRERAHGYFAFPKLEGDIGSRMKFRGKEMIVWSLNNYLGLANHPEVRKADADAAAQYGLALPMGARMMSGNSDLHEQLEAELAAFESKEDVALINYGYREWSASLMRCAAVMT